MRVLILSSGPSVLDEYKHVKDQYDITVGISTTNWLIQCDYAAFIDSVSLDKMIEPRIGYVHIRPFNSKKPVETFPLIDGNPIRLTLPATYAWAIQKWGQIPTVIGHSCSDEPNIGGLTGGHEEDRWGIEKELMELIRKHYENQ